MPDDPVVVARAGEVCRVPLVVGVEYAVTSAVPFTVSVPFDTIGRTPDGTLIIEPREGGGTTVHWPIRFSYVEEEGSTTDFTLDVQPDRLDLEYSWYVSNGELRMENMPNGKLRMENVEFVRPSLLFGGVSILNSSFSILHFTSGCGCFEYEGSTVVAHCYAGCDFRP